MITKQSSWQIQFHAQQVPQLCITHCKMHKNRPQLLEVEPLILHDNARPHIWNVVTGNLHEYGLEVLACALCSPDMSPLDFDLCVDVVSLLWRSFQQSHSTNEQKSYLKWIRKASQIRDRSLRSKETILKDCKEFITKHHEFATSTIFIINGDEIVKRSKVTNMILYPI